MIDEMIEKYCLNLHALKDIDEKEKEVIHSYYKDMCYCFHDGRKEMCFSIMNTLLIGGYLIDVRDKKIEDILNDSKG
jgi:hypothetical protein